MENLLYAHMGNYAQNAAQQSVHPTLGILARFQAFFYALAHRSQVKHINN
jgi:hypothetical protein